MLGRSLHGRLTVLLLIGSGVLLVIGGVVLDAVFSEHLAREFDRNLYARAQALVTLTSQEGDQIELDYEDHFMPEFKGGERAEYFELRLADGRQLARSTSLHDGSLPVSASLVPDLPAFSNIVLPDDRAGRLVQIAFLPRYDIPEDKPEGARTKPAHRLRAVFAVARGKEELAASIGSLRWRIGAVGVGLLGVIALLVPLAVKRGLSPLRDITKQVTHLDASSLGNRVDAPGAPTELAPIVTQLNQLLQRLEEAFTRERRFSGNVAHELRTPLAELRSLGEVGMRWPEDREMTAKFFRDLLNITDEMEVIVTNLLTLARYDAGRLEINVEPIALRELIDKCWNRVRADAENKAITLDNGVDNAEHFNSDRSALELILVNLFSNAVEYGPAGDRVRADAISRDGVKGISVANRADNLSPDDLDLIFERFWRKDTARSDGRHAGLGLALVKALADHLGLRAETELDSAHTFRISLVG